MNSTSSTPRGLAFYVMAIIGTFFLMAWLVSFVRKYTLPPPLNAARAEERAKALAELEAANANMLNNYAWADQGKGLVQLPIAVAMQLTVQEWQQPAAARSKMISLAMKTAAPATNAPALSPTPVPAPGPATVPGAQPKPPAAAPATNPPPASPATK